MIKSEAEIKRGRILGLFPSLATSEVGGIQESGRLAWRAILREWPQSQALEYQTASGANLFSVVPTRLPMARALLLRDALRAKAGQDLVLVWHLDLLRVVPFLRSKRSPIVVFLHGTEAWKSHQGFAGRMLRKVDHFLTNSDYTWDRFGNLNPESTSAAHTTVHLGLGEALKETVPPPQEPVALMVSRLLLSENYKGHEEVITAWPLVLKNCPEARLLIAGDGDLRPRLMALATALGVRDTVEFSGLISEERKQELLSRSRVLVLPSRAEGFGLVYIEAMRMGRPSVVSLEDAGREVVNPPKAGLAVDPRKPSSVADAISTLLTSESIWSKISIESIRRYKNGFQEEDFAQRLITALASIAPKALA